MAYSVRNYAPADERSWLRCRVLSFLETSYYDDVAPAKPVIEAPGFELVAVDDGTVVGVMDVSADAGGPATIETVAVHPDHQHRGIGRTLLAEALVRVRSLSATTLDAWTREDPDAVRWYERMGFTSCDRYLHVYASFDQSRDEPLRAIETRRSDLAPINLFLHGKLADEERMRRDFTRVYVNQRYVMTL